jgi:hypothetical protein
MNHMINLKNTLPSEPHFNSKNDLTKNVLLQQRQRLYLLN